MNGTIHFDTLAQVAEFLRNFVGSTAIFEVQPDGHGWVMTFSGGF